MSEEALLAAIHDNPEDTPRLVLADWPAAVGSSARFTGLKTTDAV
jgi:uncharacterized protein (TIGR02996 family)